MIHSSESSKYGLALVIMVMAVVAFQIVKQLGLTNFGLGVGLLHGMWIQIVLDQPVRTPRDGKGEAPTT